MFFFMKREEKVARFIEFRIYVRMTNTIFLFEFFFIDSKIHKLCVKRAQNIKKV